MEVLDKTILVRMRLNPSTLHSIDKISEYTGIENKAQLVGSSIQLTEELVKHMNDGAKVFIEYPNGKKSQIKMLKK